MAEIHIWLSTHTKPLRVPVKTDQELVDKLAGFGRAFRENGGNWVIPYDGPPIPDQKKIVQWIPSTASIIGFFDGDFPADMEDRIEGTNVDTVDTVQNRSDMP